MSNGTCSGGLLPRGMISADWLSHFNNLAVGETATPASSFAGERRGDRNANAAFYHVVHTMLMLTYGPEYGVVLFDLFDVNLNQSIEKIVFSGDMHRNIIGCNAF